MFQEAKESQVSFGSSAIHFPGASSERTTSLGKISMLSAKKMSQAKGFTLIELLVVIAVIGVLASIAIPQITSYRTRAVDTQMRSDVKNAVSAMESYYATQFSYPNSVAVIANHGFHPTDGVSVAINLLSLQTFT